MWKTICLIIIYKTISCSTHSRRLHNFADILKIREALIDHEYSQMCGSQITLDSKETLVNKILMHHKSKLIDDGVVNPGRFNASHHFFEYKQEVKKTPVYQMMRLLPKGALLHTHDMGLARPEFLLKLTYAPLLYVCLGHPPKFLFSSVVPRFGCDRWQLMAKARSESGNVQQFDANLKEYFSMVTSGTNPREVYPDVNAVRHKLQQVQETIKPLLTYKPVWEQYIHDALYYMYYDNICYVEFRTELFELYDSLGRKYNYTETAQVYKTVIDKFSDKYKDFYGGRLIYAPQKVSGETDLEYELQKAIELKEQFPDLIAGFDLVGQEDLSPPLKNYLVDLANQFENLDYYLHAGETNWFGIGSDENLFDAVILNAKRIGSPYALVKHPTLMKLVKQNEIGLEVNVISNQVLNLVGDIRNHPLSILLANDMPVVLGSDYNWLWEADSLTHDFYAVFTRVASRRSDLRLLKQLALNSLHYNTVKDQESMKRIFQQNWNQFLDRVISQFSYT